MNNRIKIKEILMRHMNEYPQMEVQDAVKLLYQSEFGGGHMIKEEALSLERLRAEFGEGKDIPIRERPGNRLAAGS